MMFFNIRNPKPTKADILAVELCMYVDPLVQSSVHPMRTTLKYMGLQLNYGQTMRTVITFLKINNPHM